MEFIFKAKDQSGKIREGKVEAISQEAATEMLQKNSLIPIVVKQSQASSEIAKEIQRIFEGVSQKELVVLFQQLAILIEAKVPIISSLKTIEDQLDNKYLRMVIHGIRGDVEDGMPLSESFAKHPQVFTPLMVSMVKSGELSGNLQKSIVFIAEDIEKNYQLSSKIKNALFYPIFVLVVAGIIGFIAVTVILPKLGSVIKDLGVAIPWYTSVIMGVGDFMAVYWWAVLVAILGTIGGMAYYLRTETGKREWDQIKLRLPLIGKLFTFVYITRFSSNLSILLDGGIPVVRALQMVSDIMGNGVFQKIILRGADEVKAGGNISTVMAKSADIPPIVTQMIRVGEETGKMGEILKKVSNFYENETERMTKNLAVMIEPVLIVILGVAVAILVFAILLPIYDIAGKL